MKKTTRAFLTAALGIAALWGAVPASAAPGNIPVPPVTGSELTTYATLKEAPVYTATAPGTPLRTEDAYIIDEVVFESGNERIFNVSDVFTAGDGSQWRAVSRWWKNGGYGMDFEPMFIQEEAIKKILTEEEYTAAMTPEGSASQAPSSAPASAPAAEKQAPPSEAAGQDRQEPAQEKGMGPAVPWIIAAVLLAAAAGIYVMMRRRKQTGTESTETNA